MLDTIVTSIESPPIIITRLLVGQGPAGVGYSAALFTAIETLSAGDFVSITNLGVRKASNTNYSRPAHGFVLASVLAGRVVAVQFGGVHNALTGLSIGPLWLGVDGGVISSPLLSGPGVVQQVGYASQPSSINFQPGLALVLAGTPF